ncbi:MAG: prephenate dehydrogenase [Anaerolineales bacterium]|nr:prephenate dehydrogenase [Anaerolineales bacterium]
MPVQITIIGLGQIGASLGLGLATHSDKVTVTGHDKDYNIEQRAKKLGAVEKTEHNLPGSAENADLVILALPVTEIRETFGFIAQDLKKNAVVVDTAPIKAEVAKWAGEILPETAHYVGLVPSLGPQYLNMTETGLDSAKADLFKKGVFLLSAPSGTPGDAVRLVTDLVELLGSSTILTDTLESDGFVTSTYLLPQLVSAALLNATIDQPGWQDIRKLASRDYFSTTSANLETLDTLSQHNRENTIRVLNTMIASLVDLRDKLGTGDETFAGLLKSAQQKRATWLAERIDASWKETPGEKVQTFSVVEALFGTKLWNLGKRQDGESSDE